MKQEKMIQIMDLLDEKYIAEANPTNAKKIRYKNIRNNVLRYGSLAACFVLIVVCTVGGYSFMRTERDNDVVKDPYISEYEDKQIIGIIPYESKSDESSDLVETSENDDEYKNNTISLELQKRIDELSAGDSLGWIVYDGKVYMQNWKIDYKRLDEQKDNIELSECLGLAADFIGYYQKAKGDVVGYVYMVADNPDILCVKLSNGGTVWLGVEENTESAINLDEIPPN